MPDDQTQEVSPTEGLSAEIADYFQVADKAVKAEGKEKVTPTAKDTIAEPDKDKGQVPADDKKAGEKPEAEKGKKPDEGKEPEKKPDEGKTPEPAKYSVAGVEYDNLEKAIEAVNRINGDNSRLVGDITKAEQKALDAESRYKAQEIKMREFEQANLDWQKYFEGTGEKPEAPQVNLDELLDKKLVEREKQREQATKQEAYTTETNQVLAKADYKEVKDTFEELLSEYEDKSKVSPLKLYERARAIVNGKSTKDIDEIKKEMEEKLRKELAKDGAKVLGGGGNGGSPKVEPNLSPEIADYFKNLM